MPVAIAIIPPLLERFVLGYSFIVEDIKFYALFDCFRQNGDREIER